MPVLVEDTEVQLRDKLFYKINEVSKITGLKPYVLRYWETEFPQLSPEKDDNEQRRYRRKDIDLIQRIKQLLYEEKFTIAGAKQRISSESGVDKKAVRKSAVAAEPAPTAAVASVRTFTAKQPIRPASKTAGPDIIQELSAIRKEVEELMEYLAG